MKKKSKSHPCTRTNSRLVPAFEIKAGLVLDNRLLVLLNARAVNGTWVEAILLAKTANTTRAKAVLCRRNLILLTLTFTSSRAKFF